MLCFGFGLLCAAGGLVSVALDLALQPVLLSVALATLSWQAVVQVQGWEPSGWPTGEACSLPLLRVFWLACPSAGGSSVPPGPWPCILGVAPVGTVCGDPSPSFPGASCCLVAFSTP